jgi:hypothetical protein
MCHLFIRARGRHIVNMGHLICVGYKNVGSGMLCEVHLFVVDLIGHTQILQHCLRFQEFKLLYRMLAFA